MRTYLDLSLGLMSDGHFLCFVYGLIFLAMPAFLVWSALSMAARPSMAALAWVGAQLTNRPTNHDAKEAPMYMTPVTMTDDDIREIERLEHGPILGYGVVDETGRFRPVGSTEFADYCMRVRLYVHHNTTTA